LLSGSADPDKSQAKFIVHQYFLLTDPLQKDKDPVDRHRWALASPQEAKLPFISSTSVRHTPDDTFFEVQASEKSPIASEF